jgi:hypothetical protein
MTPTTNALSRIVAALAVVCAAETAAAQPALETAFSFQARVLDAGAPADGSYDIEAALYDSPSGCCQVGSTLSLPGIWIADGSVTLELDFGALGDDAGWLEIRLRPAGGGAMTTLAPRFLLTSAPLATHALSAAEADAADDADLLEGQPASFYMEWSNHTGVPGDLADGDDDTAAALSCAAGQVAVWSAGAWTCGDDAGVRFSRTHVVAPVGDPAANGAALLAVMASIPTPTAAHEARLVKIEPGRYDLGSGYLQMKPWVDVEGSGQLTTVVASAVCDSTATLEMAADSALRSLTVENTCSDPTGVGFAIVSTKDRINIIDVTARATGPSDTSEGFALGGSDVVVRRITGIASGGTGYNWGVWFASLGGGTATDVSARATGGTHAYGAVLSGLDEVSNVDARAENATTEAIGATLHDPWFTHGVRAVANTAGSSIGLKIQIDGDCRPVAHVNARGDTALVVEVDAGFTATLDNLVLDGVTTGLDAKPYLGSGRVVLQNSTLSGATNTIVNSGLSISVAGSRLLGGPVSGTATCAGVSDETHTFYPSTCP